MLRNFEDNKNISIFALDFKKLIIKVKRKKMKKFIFSMIMLIGAISVNAQTAYEKANIFDNVYLGVNGGVTMPMTMNSVFPLNAQGSLRVGKNFTPIFGAFVEGTAIFGDNVGWGHDYCLSHTFVTMSNVGINGTVNWMNLLGGYKGVPRTFEITSVAGIGWLHTYGNNEGFDKENDLSCKTALDFAWNLGKTKAFQIYVEPQILWNLTANEGVVFNKNYAQFGATVGFNYFFNTSNGTHYFKEWNVGELNEQINSLRAENNALKNQPTKYVETVRDVPVEKFIDATTIVTFAQNSAELTDANKARLDQVKALNVTVKAYASPEGPEKFNNKLSQERANVVSEYLQNRGINVKSAVGCGVDGGDSNRIAIVSAE